MNRDECIARIRAGLKARRLPGDPVWSVSGGRGTAWGWLKIEAAPRFRTWGSRLKVGATNDYPESWEPCDTGTPGCSMSPEHVARLRELLGGCAMVGRDGVSVPAGSDYYQEYIDRAEGRPPSRIGVPYWD